MSFTVRLLPSEITFQSQQNILDDAIANSIPLEHSCKSGECSICVAKLINGTVINEYGIEVDEGSILTCQSKPTSNIELQANYYPELADLKVSVCPSKINKVVYPTNDIAILSLRLPPSLKFRFVAGQYIDLFHGGVKRSYSLAAPANDANVLELHIRRVPGGKMSEFIFEHAKSEQLMRIEGPKGTFFVRQGNRPLLFLASGTGIAPVKAMVESLFSLGDNRDIHIYWGMRYKSELYCRTLMDLAEKCTNIHFNPVLSREESWNGKKGYVQHAALEDLESLSDMDVYACGSSNMIEDSKELFCGRGLPQNAFNSDAFTPAKEF